MVDVKKEKNHREGFVGGRTEVSITLNGWGAGTEDMRLAFAQPWKFDKNQLLKPMTEWIYKPKDAHDL